MGCQNSKPVNPDILAIPPKLRPLLWRKVEEIRRRRSGAGTGSTFSKKQLLRQSHGHEETEALTRQSVNESDNEVPSLADHESVSSSAEEKIKKEMSKEDNNGEEKKAFETEKEKEEEERDIIEEGKEKEEEDNGDEERNICPGSPSFRVYYLESLEEKKGVRDHEELGNDDAKDENVVDDDQTQKKSSRESSVESIALEDSNVNEEGQETKTTTKGSKNRKRITRAIRRGPVAMKQFLNVKSCYHPSNNNESATLLAKKTDQPELN